VVGSVIREAELTNCKIDTLQPILVAYDNDQKWLVELTICIGDGIEYEDASAHIRMPLVSHAKTTEEYVGSAFSTKRNALVVAKDIALDYGMRVTALPYKRKRQPTKKELREIAEAAFLRQLTKGDTIKLINAWWTTFGNTPTWQTKKRAKAKFLTNDEQQILRRLEQRGTVIKNIQYDINQNWTSLTFNLQQTPVRATT
jgi:hypothetical protein